MIWNTSKDGPPPEHDRSQRNPRLVWLLGFQVSIIALVMLMAHATQHLTGPPTLEERLGPLSQDAGHHYPSGLRRAA